MPKAVYPGTFDPITRGHLDIIVRACKVFDGLTILLAPNNRKQPFFSVEQRLSLIQQELKELPQKCDVEIFEGLLVDAVRQVGASVIVRGLRAISDYEYELQIASLNRGMAPEVETVFMLASEGSHYISSSLVKEISSHGGDVNSLVSPAVAKALQQAFHAPRQSPQSSYRP